VNYAVTNSTSNAHILMCDKILMTVFSFIIDNHSDSQKDRGVPQIPSGNGFCNCTLSVCWI